MERSTLRLRDPWATLSSHGMWVDEHGSEATLAPAPVARTATRWLVDNADAYRETLRAIQRAGHSIWLTQLAFDADCIVHDARGVSSPGRVPTLLASVLAAAERGVAVRIILNETLLVDTVKTLRIAVRGARGDIRIRGIRRFPQLLHAKMLIVDEREAILLGSPFVNGYWDDASHAPNDARRPNRELGGRPLHDVSLHVTGPTAHALGCVFAELWNEVSAGNDDDAAIECRHRAHLAHPKPDAAAVVRTFPGGVSRSRPGGAIETLDAIERGIAAARRLIYIEHQYLSSRRVIAALVEALRREASLEIVIVLNQNPDVTAYRSWQNARLADAGLLGHPRAGVFALWRAEPADRRAHDWTINQLFVHSKVLIVDDHWLTIGSANLDGVSLHSYGDDFTGWLGRRVFRDVRNFDVNVVVRGTRDSVDNPVRELRDQLWREHIGEERAGDETSALARWRSKAADGVARLSRPPQAGAVQGGPQSIVLPYSVQSRPLAQLRDVGVEARDRIDLRFDPGWLEVHFSPNWVRNMFA